MFKKVCIALDVVFALLLLTSCASKPLIIDAELQSDQACRVYFSPGLEITACNGVAVPQKSGFGSTHSTWHDVLLPPGEKEFVLNLDWTDGNWRCTGENLTFKFKFEAGETYLIKFVRRGTFSHMFGSGVNVYKQENVKSNANEKNLIGFAILYKVG